MTAAIRVRPNPALVDDQLSVGVTGLDPGDAVTLSARLADDSRTTWRGRATFVVGPHGRLDRAGRAAAGAADVGELEGLLSQMAPEPPDRARWHPFKTALGATHVEIRADRDGREVAACDLTLQFVAPGVDRRPLCDDGLVGTVFEPSGTAAVRPVLVLGGSNGGCNEETAALLASRGLLAMALGYFDCPGLPDELVGIPLEYFERALGWLHRHPRARAGGVAVVGRSRGGELALLLGATFPVVDAVVAFVPSGIVHAGIHRGGATWHTDVPAWTLGGEPVPFLAHLREGAASAAPSGAETAPIACTPHYAADLADWEAIGRATIAVERTGGPILLLSGTEDAMWPASLFCELVMARLHAHRFAHRAEHRAFSGAGHRFVLPTLPGTVTDYAHPSDGRLYALGGSGPANARAGRLAHHAMLEWLREGAGEASGPA